MCSNTNMEVILSFFLVSFLLISLLLLFLKLLLNRSSSIKLKLPPSPPKLPIIGNLHQLGKLPHRSFRALSQKHGPLMLLNLGYTPTLIVSSPGMLREIAKNHDAVFSNRPKSTAADILFYGCLDVAFTPYGEYWRKIRKVCILELLSLKRVASFGFIKEAETAGLVHELGKASSSSFEVNLSKMLISTSNNMISRCILGQKFQENDAAISGLGEIFKRVTVQLTEFSFGDYFPYLRWVDVVTGLVSRLKKTVEELDPFLEKVIEDHMGDEQPYDHNKDIVDILLQIQKNGDLGLELSNARLKAILLDMFAGGSDTISTMLEWAMAELLINESKMKRVKHEVRMVVGKKSSIDGNDISTMKYLKCVLKETLRLHPPAALIFRETLESSEIGGYDVPPKTRVLINVWAIQRDPNIWDRPEEFIPERFESNRVDFKGHDFEFVPFGFGRRGCPGLAFAMSMVEYVMANLLYWFEWKLPDENNGTVAEKLDMPEIAGLSIRMKNPLIVVPTQLITK